MQDLAIERPIPLNSHPACQQSYMLPTPSIEDAYQHVKRCIRLRIPGSLVYAITRYGKTYFIKYALIMIALDFPGIVAVSFGCVSRNKPSEGAFFSLLLDAVNHPQATKGSIADRRARLLNKLLDLLAKSGQRRVVVFADEAQKLEREEYEWLREVHDDLERKGFRMTTFLVGQPKLVNRKTALKLSGDSQIVARFMIEESQFHGLRSVEDVRSCLTAYDKSYYPEGTQWSFTRFFMPKAWAHGYGLEKAAMDVWHAFFSVHEGLHLPGAAEMEIPMTYFTRVVEYVLTDVAPELDCADFSFTPDHWAEAVEYAKFATAQEELLNQINLEPNEYH